MKYASDDGNFVADTKAEVKAYEREQKAASKKLYTTRGLVNFLTARLPELTSEEVDAIVAAIQADPAAFREAVAPLLRKPRAIGGFTRGRRAKPQAAAA